MCTVEALKKKKIYLAVLGLACCTWHLVLRDAESFLRPMGLVAPWHVGS